MAMKITNEVFEAHLNCKFKGHLKLAGEAGTRSDYEAMTTAAKAASREQAIAKLLARSGEGGSARAANRQPPSPLRRRSRLRGGSRNRRDVEKWTTVVGGRDARGR